MRVKLSVYINAIGRFAGMYLSKVGCGKFAIGISCYLLYGVRSTPYGYSVYGVLTSITVTMQAIINECD